MPSIDHDQGASGRKPPRLLQAEDFTPFVGRRVQFAEAGLELVLDRVDRPNGLGAGAALPPNLPRAPFSLLFRSPKGSTYLREGSYRFDFGEGAVFDIHVAPIHTPAADRQDYEAVFN